MSKNIWHDKKEKPTKKLHCNRIIITKWGSCLDEIDIDNGATIETDWAFLDDLLALETENKDLSDKIGKLEKNTHKALDIAIDELTKIKVAAASVDIGFFMTAAISALEKIKTTLEQKDVK